MKNILKNRNYLTIFLSLIIFLFINIPILKIGLDVLNQKLNNFILFTKIEKQKKLQSFNISDNIVIVSIDDNSLSTYGFPLPRRLYTVLIEKLNYGGAEVIGFDILFSDDNFLDKEGDDIFSDSISKAGNIVLGSSIISSNVNGKLTNILDEPLSKFKSGALSYGYFNLNVNSDTNVADSYFPQLSISDKAGNIGVYNHFSVSLVESYFSRLFKNQELINSGFSDDSYFYLLDRFKIPFSENRSKRILINYLPQPSNQQRYSSLEYYSFLDILEDRVNPNVFDGKIVIVGFTAKGIKDTFITYNGLEYGVFVLGNIVNNILTQNYLVYLNKNLEKILLFMLILVSVYFNLSRSGYVLLISNISIIIIFLIIYPFYITIFTSYIFSYLAHLFFALVISLTLSNLVKYITENKNKNKLNKALSEYVSKAIADEILSNSGKVNLDGEKKKLAIYFSDIEGFTSISEKFEPEYLVKFLREYLSEMSDLIMDSSGFINKYEGDAIMALWGAFIDYDKGGYHACYTSLKQQELLRDLNKKWSIEGFNEIKTRMGIHIGDAIVGNIGSTGRKMEFTALGDSVNLASRLEGVNKFYGTYICVSEDVYNENKEYFEFRYLDKIKVKGKDNPIKIYELLSIKGELDNTKKEIVSMFEKAISLYISRDFFGAKDIFSDLISKGDKPSITYLDMCELYIKTPPGDDWEGISIMNSK